MCQRQGTGQPLVPPQKVVTNSGDFRGAVITCVRGRVIYRYATEQPHADLPGHTLEAGEELRIDRYIGLQVYDSIWARSATLDRLRSGYQWDRQIEPGTVVRWQNTDGSQGYIDG